MKTKNDFARAFIDLARLGRTDWQATALTILILAFVIAVGTLVVLMLPIPGIQSFRSLYFDNFSVIAAIKSLLLDAGGPAGVLGFWLACRFVLRRPFRSLISVDLKFSVRRFLFGAALYLPAFVISVMVMWLYTSLRFGTDAFPFGHFQLPKNDLNLNPVLRALSALAMWLGIAFLAFGEELYLRGWMTQTLGQYIRAPVVVVVLVAVLFAMFHTQYEWPVKIVMLFCSFGFSVLSLRDRRLELAVGAHSMMNFCGTLIPMFFTSVQLHPHVAATTFIAHPVLIMDVLIFAVNKGVLPFVLMYLFLQKTNGWFTPIDDRSPNDENTFSKERCA